MVRVNLNEINNEEDIKSLRAAYASLCSRFEQFVSSTRISIKPTVSDASSRQAIPSKYSYSSNILNSNIMHKKVFESKRNRKRHRSYPGFSTPRNLIRREHGPRRYFFNGSTRAMDTLSTQTEQKSISAPRADL